MRIPNSILLLVSLSLISCVQAQDYPVSLFGIKSDGVSLNTRSIQFAIDYINRKGGGRLVFAVGRYKTGSLHMRSKVTLHLEEGAELIGSENPLDYEREVYTALIFGSGEHDIGITGKGTVDGRGTQVALNILALVHSGLVADPLRNDRPAEAARPMLISFLSCENIQVKNVTLKNSASWVQTYERCKRVILDSIHVDSKAYWNNDGIDIVDCDSVELKNSYIDAADDGICLKSQDQALVCRRIRIENNTIRSSANALKLGTASLGGFSQISISNIRVFDTYRSAIALEAVDGGYIDDLKINGVRATHTGNAMFIRIGERIGGRKSRISNIQIRDVDVEIAEGKPDSGYSYEGPIEDQPRNISPIVITGLPDNLIEKIVLKDISVQYPGGGIKEFAFRSMDKLDSIPELPGKYPEYSMFRELPAWGMYLRHVAHLDCSELKLNCKRSDYRVAVILDDVNHSTFEKSIINEPGRKKPFYFHRCREVLIR